MRHVLPTALCAWCASSAAIAGGEVIETPIIAIANIPDNNDQGVSAVIQVAAPQGSVVTGASLDVEILHAWVGDLRVELRSPTGTTLVLLDRAGLPNEGGFPGPFGCGGLDIVATFSDAASKMGQDVCSTTAQPVIDGDVRPLGSFSVFGGEPAAGGWNLVVSDRSEYDTGVLIGATLTLTAERVCIPDLDGSGSLDFGDVSGFLAFFAAGDLAVDFDGSGSLDFGDVSAFLGLFAQGCP